METKRSYKSFRYRTRTVWSSARRGVLSAPAKPDVVVGSPPEFRGDPENWAPEELLVGSLNTCAMLTFLSLAQAQGVNPVGYETDAEGVLEHVEGKYRISQIIVRPRVTLKSATELEPARKAMDAVEDHCFIASSITAKVTFAPEFTLASQAPQAGRQGSL